MRSAILLLASSMLLAGSAGVAQADCKRLKDRTTTVSGVVGPGELIEDVEMWVFGANIRVGPGCTLVEVGMEEERMPAACKEGRRFTATGELFILSDKKPNEAALDVSKMTCR